MNDQKNTYEARNSSSGIKPSYDLEISVFLQLPDFVGKGRERKKLSGRARNALSYHLPENIITLNDLKKYVEENGWFHRHGEGSPRIRDLGRKSVAYFNDVLKKYGYNPMEELNNNNEFNEVLKKHGLNQMEKPINSAK
jgi:hypothetical protein